MGQDGDNKNEKQAGVSKVCSMGQHWPSAHFCTYLLDTACPYMSLLSTAILSYSGFTEIVATEMMGVAKLMDHLALCNKSSWASDLKEELTTLVNGLGMESERKQIKDFL